MGNLAQVSQFAASEFVQDLPRLLFSYRILLVALMPGQEAEGPQGYFRVVGDRLQGGDDGIASEGNRIPR